MAAQSGDALNTPISRYPARSPSRANPASAQHRRGVGAQTPPPLCHIRLTRPCACRRAMPPAPLAETPRLHAPSPGVGRIGKSRPGRGRHRCKAA